MIVGVGASAGGLNAFEAFLRGIPGGDAFGYVLVQHLDPTHESELPGILQRVTPVDVRHVTEGMSVEPGEIYVIPSGKFLTIEDGVLQLGFPDDSTSVRTPIDTFLRSLAHDQGANASCVILSGTGTDGALGLKAVKENGEICLVQAPDEAQYEGMPRAALATDLVDVVAPAGELGERLAAYRRTSPALPVDTVADTDADREEKMLVDVFSVVQTHTGLDFSSYNEATDVGTLFLSHDLELRRYTARATDLFHVIPADLGRPLAHLTHKITEADPAALVKQVLKTQTPLTRELQSTTGDWFKLRVLPYRTVEEAVEGGSSLSSR